MEIWYPAGAEHAGEDLARGTRDEYELLPGFPAVWQNAVRNAAPRNGRYPLLAFSHGWGGHRRQSTFMCTHLASHGFIVVAIDHAGNTIVDMMPVPAGGRGAVSGTVADPSAVMTARPAEVAALIDQALEDCGGLARFVDRDRIGMMGHSFGGWTALAVAEADPRIGATLALAPAGGSGSIASVAPGGGPGFERVRSVPTLLIAADGDCVLPLRGMYEVFELLALPKRMVVLKDADHFHFLDRAEQVHEFVRAGAFRPLASMGRRMRPFAELCAERSAHRAVSGLALAHMDAALKRDQAAKRFLTHIESALADIGVGGLVV